VEAWPPIQRPDVTAGSLWTVPASPTFGLRDPAGRRNAPLSWQPRAAT